jgi:allantoinase
MWEWLSPAPAALAGLDGRKGSFGLGSDADLVVWDPDEAFRVDEAKLWHRHSLSPYQGMELFGRVRTVVLGGEIAYDDGPVDGPRGRMLTRQ